MRGRRPLAAALVFVALNLRVAIGALPPVLGQIRHQTGLSSAGGGVLSAVPALCFGVFALGSPWLIRRLGMRLLLILVMLVIAAGCALRLAPPLAALFLGTAVLSSGIAVGNVLVPGLIKRDFRDHTVGMTALYSVALNGGAALSAGLTVPIEHATHAGWRPAVAVWGVLALVALVLWMPHVRHEPEAAPAGAAVATRALWRDRLAWCVTLVMGLQSFGYYAMLSWIPTILREHGLSQAAAGGLLSYSMFPGMLGSFVTPSLERRVRRPWLLVLISATLTGCAYAGLLAAPGHVQYLWMTLLGLGQGMSLALALGYIVARAPDGHHAAQLSTMAQSVGYLIAASGPFLLGALHGLTGGWTVPMALMIAILVPWVLVGLAASRDRYVLAAGSAVGT